MIEQLGQQAQQAAQVLAISSSAVRDAALQAMADALHAQQAEILAANEQDLAAARENNMRDSLQDRLRLTSERIAGMQQGILEIMQQSDPLGLVLGGGVRPNGLRIQQVSVPLGVVGMIYEARPNVTADAAALCLKSGNAVILRGGREAIHSNTAIANTLRSAIAHAGLPEDCVQLVSDTSRDSATAMMQAVGLIDVLIPRGGAGLINAVVQNSRVPVIETGAGVCHTYVDAAADLDMALAIVENAKCSRPSVCNACETVLVHADIAEKFLPMMEQRMPQVQFRHDEDSWGVEFGDLTLAVRVVTGVDEAVAHISRWGTKHSECIVTESYTAAQAFLQQVDAAAVYVNASTRYTDGGEFGLGAEIGIATQKLHARGPLGLRHLTSSKYVIYGNGQCR
ncbi:MAG: glutamate-5-semialdehyde dehydrogenase [Oscillospiraceae bacterium]|nr:glutamate-5-semialdehyde dehydrogenase [Oscillospiraceae bacterium]